MKDPSDNLSPLARRILKLDAATAYEKLIITPTSGNPRALADLTSASPASLLSNPVKSGGGEDEASCLLAALWLWQDYLDESHEICQVVHTATGSLWHAILHRREGDFSNAKYWYRRAAQESAEESEASENTGGGHPLFQSFANNATALLSDTPADLTLLRLTTPHTALPALVDLVSKVQSSPTPPSHPLYRTAIALQQLEFRLLFELTASAAQK